MGEPLQVTIITRDYPPRIGGIATHVSELSNHLMGFGVTPVILVGKGDVRTLLMILRHRNEISKSNVIHVQSTPYAAFVRRHPLVITAHSPVSEEKKYYRGLNRLKAVFAQTLERAGVKNADTVIAVSKQTAELLTKDYGVPESKITVIPNGVDRSRFSPGAKSVDNPSVLLASRLDKRKNVGFALRGFGHLEGMRYRLTVIGGGPERVELERLSKKLGLGARFAGAVDAAEVPEYFNSADIFVSASHSEGFGISVLQAMSSGCAILASDIEPHRELIEDGVEGYLYRTDADYVQRLKDLVSNPDLRSRFGTRAREKAAPYTWERIAAATSEVYRHLIEEHKN